MTRDVLDRPLGASPKMELSIWQQRQVAYLYHVTSVLGLNHLKSLDPHFRRDDDVILSSLKMCSRHYALPIWRS